MKIGARVAVIVLVITFTVAVVGTSWLSDSFVIDSTALQTLASPGKLSAAHGFLSDKCSSCHTAVKGVEAINCIVCHANDQALLQRQPTAFHATVASCAECHLEHQGPAVRPSEMDHAVFAKLTLQHASHSNTTEPAVSTVHESGIKWIDQQNSLPSGHPSVSPLEAALNCAACHSSEDRHRGYFGTSCVQCHAVDTWSISKFRHPSPASTSCAQCHQAPPSHYMMHFEMVSMRVAHQPHAKVNQCFLCHQTNDWNDIKGVGWYKHH